MIRQTVALVLAASLALAPALAQNPTQARQGYTYQVTSDLVLVNVVVREKSGALVGDLKPRDFTVLEDGKPQQIHSFDVERPEAFAAREMSSQASLRGAPEALKVLTADPAASDVARDRRLVVVFFDFSSMQPDEVARAIKAASDYVQKQMSPADLVSIVTLANSMKVAQDFTNDPAALKQALSRLSSQGGEGFESGATGDSEGQPDTGQEFTADDTEYNLFNTDRRLQAIASLAQSLSRLQQKKSVLYFSGGMGRTGVENQSQLRAAINAAVRANVSLYAVDTRGLQALPPGGSAHSGSLRGTSAYSGRAVQSQLDSNFASQETLTTLAADTGGKAFLDSNDFSRAFAKMQTDTASYYVLGYRSANKNMDGRYRRIVVRVNRRDVKLEHRSGYYGPRDFAHSTRQHREQQLQEELASELPRTDVPVYLATAYFRMQEDKFFVPVALVVPGSAVPFTRAEEKDKATIDVVGVVRESRSTFPVGSLRETVRLAVDGQQGARRKNIQYSTGFLLPSGRYRLKFVVRENQTGRLGSFEADIMVPDMRKAPLKMSSVLLSSQRGPAGKHKQSPLLRDGAELAPNVAHVFATDQQLTFYYEVYDPGRDKASSKGVRLLTNVQFFSGKVNMYETALVEARELNQPNRKAAAFQLEVPLARLRPGFYTCQVNVIDDVSGSFSFPRVPILVRKAAAAPAVTSSTAPDPVKPN